MNISYLLPIIILSVICNEINGKTSDSLRITLPNGSKLIGRHMTSSEGKGIRAFMGIPYAEPPIGQLRFKAPVPKAPWTDELRVTKDSEICSQRDPYRRAKEVTGSEDCLYLNVYTPQNATPKQSLSVMVYFHGGGWISGAGISSFYGPDFLLNHDIIYVIGNYRLGTLGFLSTEQEDCPGNFGLKDQALILKWVNENIKVFGGNPNSVTIFGESAGGASVTYAMQSPLTKGLFHRGISQSGTNLTPWGSPLHKGMASKRASKVAELVGCPKGAETTWKTTINCMRNVPHDKITNTLFEFFKWDIDPIIPFGIVIEPDLPGAYLLEHPRDVSNPQNADIPWMTGITSDEGLMKSAFLWKRPDLYDDVKYRSHEIYPIAFYYDHHDQVVQDRITKEINQFYFNDETLSEKHNQNLTNLFTDAWFLSGMDEYLNIRLANIKSANTFVYLFGHVGQSSFTEVLHGGVDEIHGVCHIDELLYLFPMEKETFVTAVPNETDLKIRKLLTEMWINFARTGNPTPSDSKLIKWKQSKEYPIDFLRIGNRDYENQSLIAMESNSLEERIEFWRKIKPFLPAEQRIREEL